MNEMQITAILIGLVTFLVSTYLLRRRAAARREMMDEQEALEQFAIHDTGRDESEWRRAYSRG